MSDPWAALRRHTAARIGLGHVGGSLPTRAVLAFQAAHAEARDAVLVPWDPASLAAELAEDGVPSVIVASAAPDRATYLRRPDLGRTLARGEAERLRALSPPPFDLAVLVSNGLSTTAVARHGRAFLAALRAAARAHGLSLGPVVLAAQGRVALGDGVGEALAAPAIAVVLGERPGLTSADSLGLYLTFGPRPGRTDAERNCLSNVRPDGLPLAEGAARLLWLAKEAQRRRSSGVLLKDETPTGWLAAAETPPELPPAR